MELEVIARPEDEETVVAALDDCGTLGAWSVGGGIVRGYFSATARRPAEAFGAAWRALCPDDDPPPVTQRIVPATDWLARWRARARPVAVTPTLWVGPPGPGWDSAGVPAGAVRVLIQPGQGFGTGTHPTTRALLAWLQEEPDFARVLDVGTGSGVLALSGLALGARRAVALDLDAAALENAARNGCLNGCRGSLDLIRGSLDALRPGVRFDRVLANLDGRALELLLPDLAARVATGGRLGVAGLLLGERRPFLRAMTTTCLTLLDETTERDRTGGETWWSAWIGR